MNERELTNLKNRFDIVGNDPQLNRALEIAAAIAPTDLAVLVCGESGAGKENIPKIIHQYSLRRSGKYLSVNCGAIPEGTIDSELFGHEKGAFTGAVDARRGYFEEADGGTLFLDEIGELPLASQARLLRVLQEGEFIRVGSSKVMKTNVRVIAATNKDLAYAVSQGKFRADLYYRLNSVPINMPALRERREDIHIFFRKFAADFAEKYSRCGVRLTEDAVAMLVNYRWPGNIRQLRNVTETLCALETSRMAPGMETVTITASTLSKYIPKDPDNLLPALSGRQEGAMSADEREMLLRVLGQMKREIDDLKVAVYGSATSPAAGAFIPSSHNAPAESPLARGLRTDADGYDAPEEQSFDVQDTGHVENLKIQDISDDLVRKALDTYGSRREAALALGISERTLYRKLKSLGIK